MSTISNHSIQPDWQSYICKMNDEVASVYVDLNLSARAPLATKPKLAWLWIKMNSPRDDGLSSDDEFDSLCTFEDDLEEALVQSESCIYAGRITTKGRREFYFYVGPNFDFVKATDGVLAAHSEYSFQRGEKTDECWNHYFSTLFPASNGVEQIERNASRRREW